LSAGTLPAPVSRFGMATVALALFPVIAGVKLIASHNETKIGTKRAVHRLGS